MNAEEQKAAMARAALVKEEIHCQNGWDFKFQTAGIMTTDELDHLSDYLALNMTPDVVFGKNRAQIINKKYNFVYEINPRDSLRFCNYKARETRFIKEQGDIKNKSDAINHVNVIPGVVKIKQNAIWKNKKIDPEIQQDIKEIVQISDPFFSTGYKGTIKKLDIDPKNELQYFRSEAETKIDLGKSVDEKTYPYTESTDDEIPLGNLTEKNPITWHSMIDLWEDELDDNGHTVSEFRFRTMGDCFFGLIRHYLRLDDVIVRIYDTRIYHDFKWNYILREFTVKEDNYENIAKKGFQFTPKWMCDPGQSHMVNPFVKQVYQFKEKIYFAPEQQQQQQQQ